MVLVHDTSSECALQMYEVSLKLLSSYRADMILWLTDRQTDGGQTDAKGKHYVSRPYQEDDIMTKS